MLKTMGRTIRSVIHSRRFRVLAAFSVSIIILVVLYGKIGVRAGKMIDEWRRADKGILALTFVFSALWHLFVGADKWCRILRGLGAKVGYWEVFRVRLGSDPIRFASPFKTGELVNAAYFYEKGTLSFGRSASSILFDKVLNYIGTWFWLFVGLVVLGKVPWMREWPFIAALGVATVLLFASERVRRLIVRAAVRIHPKVRRITEGVLSTFEEFPPRRKLFFILYGIVFQLRPLIVCSLLFLAFGVKPGLREILTFGSLVVLASNVPFTTAGIGPRELTLALLFSQYGSREMLYSIGLLMSFSIHIVPAILGLPFMPPLLRVGLAAATGEREEVPEPEPAPVPVAEPEGQP